MRLRLSPHALRGRPALAVALLTFLVVFGSVVWLAADTYYRDHVVPGVSTLGVRLGGESRIAASEALVRLAGEYNNQWLTLRYGERTWNATLADLGVQLDVEQTLDTALRYGRQGTVFEQAGDRWRAWREGTTVAPALAFNDARWTEVLAAIAGPIDLPARDARLVVERDARIRIEAAADGRRVNSRATLAALQSALAIGRPHELTLVVDRLVPAITEGDWRGASAQAAEMLRSPVTLTFENRRWQLNPADLAPAVVPRAQRRGGLAEPQIALDGQVLRALLTRVAAEVNTAPKNATLDVVDGQVVIVRGTVGRALDFDVTVSALEQALRRTQDRTAAVATREVIPALTSQDLAAVRERAQRALSKPIVITHESRRWSLLPATLADMATFAEVQRDGRPDIELRLDPEATRRAMSRISVAVNRPAQNARFDLRGRELVPIQAAKSGWEVQMDEMVAALTAAVLGDERTVPLRMGVALPQITETGGAQAIGRDLVMDASTVYGGTLPARMHNIELAASRLNGTLIPPGALFSFNKALGPARLSDGYRVGYGIVLKDGQPETVPSDAGGICQVATTIFQAVFWAGYKVEERNWHLYWIPRYGQQPRGRTGLDATVDDEYGVDFRFRNNSPDWLLVQATTDRKNITFRLVGTKPKWEVRVEGPVIASVVKSDPTEVLQEDPSMPAGGRLQIEAAADGFNARFDRTVVQDGQVVDRWTARSSYIPSRNVILVGPEPPPDPAAPGTEPAATANTPPAPAPAAPPAASAPGAAPSAPAKPR